MRAGGPGGDRDVERGRLAGAHRPHLSRLQLLHSAPPGLRSHQGAAAARLAQVLLVGVVPQREVRQAGLELLHLIRPGERNAPGLLLLLLLPRQLSVGIQILKFILLLICKERETHFFSVKKVILL